MSLGCAVALGAGALNLIPVGFGAGDFLGDLEIDARVVGVADTSYTQLNTRARAFLRQDLGAGASLELGVEARSYSGKTAFALTDLLPQAMSDELQATLDSLQSWGDLFVHAGSGRGGIPNGRLVQATSLDRVRIDRALIRWRSGRFSLDVGRQPLAWGAGYAWNPTNLFYRKDPFEVARDPEGQDLLLARWDLGATTGLQLAVRPDDRPEDLAAIVRGFSSMAGLDLAAVYGEERLRWMDWSDVGTQGPMSRPIRWEFEAEDPWVVIFTEEPRHRLAGGEVRGELFGVALWGEATWNWIEGKGEYSAWAAGADHVFDTETFAAVEFYHYGLGATPPYGLEDWLKALSGERSSLGQDYGLAVANHPVGDLDELTGILLTNLTDESGIAELRWARSLGNDLSCTAALQWPWGEDGDEFGRLGGGGFLRWSAFF